MTSRVLAAALFALVLTSSAASAAPTLREVEQKVITALKRESSIKSVKSRGDGCIEITTTAEAEMFSCFDNLMLRIQGGENANAAIASFAANTLQVISSLPGIEASLGAVRPVLRSIEMLDAFDAQLQQAPRPSRLVRLQFHGNAAIAFVFDMPGGMRLMVESDLNELNITAADLLPIAKANLKPSLKDLKWETRNSALSGTLLIARLDQTYESSLPLLDDIWADIEKQLGGPIAIAAPSRDTLFVMRADQPAAIAMLQQFARANVAYPVSNTVLRRENGNWVTVGR